jgi:hypothetical protein
VSAINENLLAAAKAYRDKSYPFLSDNPTRQEEYAAAELATQMDKAIAAAERELAERLKPIDEEWLSKVAIQSADVFCINGVWQVWYGEHCKEWLVRHDSWAIAIAMKSKSQLLALLSGLGIEVAK